MKEILFLILISIIYLTLHLHNLCVPPTPYGDGYYYVPAAREIFTHREDPNEEHPPLGKEILAASIKIFGDNPYGWRLPALLAGLLATIVLYFFAKNITKSAFIAAVSVVLLNLDTLWFLHSQIEMLDIFVSFFILACIFSFWIYLKSNSRKALIITGVTLGLALATKWVAALLLILIGAFLFSRKVHKKDLLLLILSALAIYTLSYYFYIEKNGLLAFLRLQAMSSGSHLGGGKQITTKASPAYSWLTSFKIIPYLDSPPISARLNPLILIASLPSWIILLIQSLKRRSLNLLFVAASAAILYLPWFFIPQPTFLFYILPALPFFCLSIAIVLIDLWRKNLPGKIGALAYLGGAIIAFASWLGYD